MAALWRILLNLPFIKPLLRLLVGVIAVPVFRWFLRRVVRLNDLNEELEKDLEQWFRASLLLLVATANMEDALFGWVPLELDGKHAWISVGLRLMLAIGVTEAMPDQALFQIIHANPPPPNLKDLGFFKRWGTWIFWMGKAFICKHLDRSSQVLAILAALFPGVVGWSCYGVAISQYLLIGLVTSRKRAVDVLQTYDEQVRQRREWLVEKLHIPEDQAPSEFMDDWFPVEAVPNSAAPSEYNSDIAFALAQGRQAQERTR